MPLILAIDNDPACHLILKNSLSSSYDISFFHRQKEITPSVLNNGFDLCVVNLDDQGPGSLVFLETLINNPANAPVIVTSQKDDSDWIVSVVRAGAFDFIAKPWSGEKIKLAVERALEKSSLEAELDYLRRQQDVVYDMGRIIARSPSMKSVMNLVEKYSLTDSNVLLTGETGTGKSYLAGAMHFNSPRKHRPFVKINCANIPETLLESELFGHERGTFTDAIRTRKGRVEQARGGTVFLDEIAEMGHSLQSRFLRFVEEKSFERLGGNRTIHSDVRVIAATNQDLSSMVKKGEFRRDLYYRLNVLAIHLPGLRHRQECIEPLARHILKKVFRSSGITVKDISQAAVELMKRYPWPGNIRELANVIERAVILENGPIISDKGVHLNSGAMATPDTPESCEDSKNLHQSEYKNILDALENNLWVQKKAAQELGISPRALNYRIKKYGITHWSWRKHRD